MKMKHWLILPALAAFGWMTAYGDTPVAPVVTNTLPAIVAPATTNLPTTILPLATNAPAKPVAPKKKIVAAKPAAKVAPAKKPEAKPEPSVPLLAPEPATARQNHLNIRAQASINSEVIAHLQKGDRVTALEEITLSKPKADEPTRWLRVSLPTNVAVWVSALFIDPATKTVVPKKLNLRAGPGENYSVLGRLEKGAAIQQIEAKGDWLKIEAPTNVYGFVASHLMKREPAGPPAIVDTTEVKTNLVGIVPPPTTPVVPPVVPPIEPVVPAVRTPVVIEPVIEPSVRIVTRQGVLRGSVSIQAPTYFELRAIDTGKTINYVHAASTNLVLKNFKGSTVIVTGEELLDERWPNTPVIDVDNVQIVP